MSYAQSIFKVPSFEITYNEIKKEHQRSGTGNHGFRGVTRIARKGSSKEEKVGKNVKCHREDGPGKDPPCPRGLTFRWHASLGASQVALVVKNPPANARDIRDMGSIPGSGRPPEGGHGHPLQCFSLENPMDRGAWQAAVHRVAKSWTQLKRFSMHTR